jgi:hypothetical protein
MFFLFESHDSTSSIKLYNILGQHWTGVVITLTIILSTKLEGTQVIVFHMPVSYTHLTLPTID